MAQTIIARLINGPRDGELYEIPAEWRVVRCAEFCAPAFAVPRPGVLPVESLAFDTIEYVRVDWGLPGVPVPFLYRDRDGRLSAPWEGDH